MKESFHKGGWFLGSILLALFLLGIFSSLVYATEKKGKKEFFEINQKDRSSSKIQQNNSQIEKGTQIMQYELPPLPYDYNALEPYYDERTLRLHHDKHHAGYVKGLNTALEKLVEAREKGDYSLIKYWERNLAFHGSGHLLHSLFWKNMAPNAGGSPKGLLANQIASDFGSYEAFRQQFSYAAAAVEGSGWTVLGWEPTLKKLEVLQIENHQKLTLWGIQPLLVIDVWEHAYYLKYQNQRAEWIKNWWDLVNWNDVEQRYEKLPH